MLSERIPALREVKPLAENLNRLVSMGAAALSYLASKKQPGDKWLENQKNLLSEVKKPRAECQLAIMPAVEKLLMALEENRK